MLARLQPDVIVSVYPAYSHMLDELLGWEGAPEHKRVVVITDSISVNAIWYRCSADYFLLPNEPSGRSSCRDFSGKDKYVGFPSARFAQPGKFIAPSTSRAPRPLHNQRLEFRAPQLVRRLADA